MRGRTPNSDQDTARFGAALDSDPDGSFRLLRVFWDGVDTGHYYLLFSGPLIVPAVETEDVPTIPRVCLFDASPGNHQYDVDQVGPQLLRVSVNWAGWAVTGTPWAWPAYVSTAGAQFVASGGVLAIGAAPTYYASYTFTAFNVPSVYTRPDASSYVWSEPIDGGTVYFDADIRRWLFVDSISAESFTTPALENGSFSLNPDDWAPLNPADIGGINFIGHS